MIRIKSFDTTTEILTFLCECNEIVEADLSKIEELSFLEQFDEYDNLSQECKNCKRVHFFNANIPVSEYEEVAFEEFAPQYSEINDRKILRDILWKKRKDLKKLDRTKYNEGKKHFYAKQKKEIQELKKQIRMNKPPRNL